MKNKMRMFLIAGSFVLTSTIAGKAGSLETVNAAGVQKEMRIAEETTLQLIAYDLENDIALAVVSENTNGIVTGDGVRLRLEPSTSGAVLEKMYSGEYVLITKTQGGWYHVKRVKTGTIGWVSSNYIQKISS